MAVGVKCPYQNSFAISLMPAHTNIIPSMANATSTPRAIAENFWGRYSIPLKARTIHNTPVRIGTIIN